MAAYGDGKWRGEDMDLAERLTFFQHDYPYSEITMCGTPWRYRVGGVPDGPIVLLLPGATMVPDPFFLVIGALGQRYRVIAVAYPPVQTMAALVAGVAAILDAEHVSAAHVIGSSFGGYVAQCLVRNHPDRVDTLILAQTGVRHFAGPAGVTALYWVLEASPTGVVRWFIWRTWRALIADIGADQQFWLALLRRILYTELSKAHLVAVTAAIRDFAAHYRPTSGEPPRLAQPVLVLHSEQDRAFVAQANEIRAAYPGAIFRTLLGAGHGALFTHTDQYIREIETFLEAHTTPSDDDKHAGRTGD
jgi:pimeloyl-ACP methyl ester carboxylesterase